MIDPNNRIFVHSDVGYGLLAAKKNNAKINIKDICLSLFDFIKLYVGNDEGKLIFPAFNYDFGSTYIFKPYKDPVQVGILPEWVRKNTEFNRSEVPIFSSLFQKEQVEIKTDEINPFGETSVFNELVDEDATIFLFGTSLNCLTFIHYIEELTGKPCYRYEKKITGKIINRNNEVRNCTLKMHVRPLGVNLDYDWVRLEKDLIDQNILIIDENSRHLKHLKARKLLEYWGNRIISDPFFLLDMQSRVYFKEKTFNGSQRVNKKEFESDN